MITMSNELVQLVQLKPSALMVDKRAIMAKKFDDITLLIAPLIER